MLFVSLLIIVAIFVATVGADRSACSPDVGNQLHAVVWCEAVLALSSVGLDDLAIVDDL